MELTSLVGFAIVVFASVAVIFLFIGHKGAKYSTTVQGLFLMSGKLGLKPFVGTLAASNFSLGNMIYVSMIWGYLFGFSAILWLCFGFIVAAAVYVNFLKYFPAFRSYIEDTRNSGSVHEYLEFRARRDSTDRNARRIRLAASFVTILGLLIALTFEIYLATLLFSLISEAHPVTIFLVLTALICVYSAHGGFWAVVWTDFVQSLLLIVGAVAIIAIVLSLDFPFASFSEIYAESYKFEIISAPDLFTAPGWAGITTVIMTFFWYLVTMDTWQRASASRSRLTAAKGMIGGTVCLVIGIIVFSGFGIYDRLVILPSLSQELAAAHSQGYNPLSDLFLLGDQLGSSWQWVLGFIAVAFIVAGLSTADTYILVCGHSFVSDVVVGFRKKASFGHLTDTESTLFAGVGKFTILGMGLFVILSYFAFKGIGILDNPLYFFFVAFSIQFALLAPVLFSVRRRRPSSGVVLVAILASVVVSLFWGVGSAVLLQASFPPILGIPVETLVFLTPFPTMIVGIFILGFGLRAGWCVVD